MDMIDVRKKTSHISAFGFDGDKLRVEFPNGAQYDYFGVSPKMFETMVEANDINNLGTYFANVVRPNRKYERVNDALPRPPQDEGEENASE